MHGRNGVFQTAAHFKVQVAHGTGGNKAVGAGLDGAADNPVDDGGNEFRFGYGEKGSAAAGSKGPGKRFGSQGGENLFHQADICFLVLQGVRS